MDWIAESRSEAEMLSRIDRTPLDVGSVACHAEMAALVEGHNAALSALDQRFKQLADVRAAKQDRNIIFLRDGATLRGEHDRMINETWDVLVDLRKQLQQRRTVIDGLLTHIAEHQALLQKRREAAFADAEAIESRKHRAYVKARALRGTAFVEQLAEEHVDVSALDSQIRDADELYAHLESMRHRAQSDERHVTMRQRDVIGYLEA